MYPTMAPTYSSIPDGIAPWCNASAPATRAGSMLGSEQDYSCTEIVPCKKQHFASTMTWPKKRYNKRLGWHEREEKRHERKIFPAI